MPALAFPPNRDSSNTKKFSHKIPQAYRDGCQDFLDIKDSKGVRKEVVYLTRVGEACMYEYKEKINGFNALASTDPSTLGKQRNHLTISALAAIGQFVRDFPVMESEEANRWITMTRPRGNLYTKTQGWLNNVGSQSPLQRDAKLSKKSCEEYLRGLYEAVRVEVHRIAAEFGIKNKDVHLGNFLIDEVQKLNDKTGELELVSRVEFLDWSNWDSVDGQTPSQVAYEAMNYLMSLQPITGGLSSHGYAVKGICD
ncbi:hypothetical protein FRC02_005373 [Tulasnella sp. 418]|nr:hypothetical protein FRC02_005373 [Tulasnella sp. 418]